MDTPLAYSIRQLSLRTKVCRAVYGKEIAAGRLRAKLISKHRYLILHDDFMAWARSNPVQPDPDAAHVEQLLEREARRVG